jgi:hypothetical protein
VIHDVGGNQTCRQLATTETRWAIIVHVVSALTDDELDPRPIPGWHLPTDVSGLLEVLRETTSLGSTDAERIRSLSRLPAWRQVPGRLADELALAGLLEPASWHPTREVSNLIADNPWGSLPGSGDLVLDGDRAGALGYASWKVPSPWSGPAFTADILILLLNPGLAEDVDRGDLKNPAFRRMAWNQLSGTADFPWCKPEWIDSGGGRYWYRRLRHLIADSSAQAIASRVAVVEWVAYSSRDWVAPRAPLASQDFTQRVVQTAVSRGAAIVMIRGLRQWLSLVPELGQVRLIRTRSPRYSGLSPGNLDQVDYARLVDLLRRSP